MSTDESTPKCPNTIAGRKNAIEKTQGEAGSGTYRKKKFTIECVFCCAVKKHKRFFISKISHFSCFCVVSIFFF